MPKAKKYLINKHHSMLILSEQACTQEIKRIYWASEALTL
jgi:hypothetical protein